ncbi:hypothetical protein Scep_004359 [Stephania cephalantha]|uniref:Uncharacterized protein n=1 Tax=Stephania cephalantha TaxID=152367 RepID=A0AAP0KUV2_9MAGN
MPFLMPLTINASWITRIFGYDIRVSHLFLVDGLILYAEASEAQAEVISSILHTFCDHFGHKITLTQSQVFFSPNVDPFWLVRLQGSRVSLSQRIWVSILVSHYSIAELFEVPMLILNKRSMIEHIVGTLPISLWRTNPHSHSPQIPLYTM